MLQINSSSNFKEISITSIKGQILYNSSTNEKEIQIPANLPNGMYLIKVNDQSPNTLIIHND